MIKFNDPETFEAIMIELRDGAVERVLDAGIDGLQGVDASSLHISGARMVLAAKKASVYPGVNWALGYHFVYDAGKHVAVLGIDKTGARKAILFDPFTGAMVTPGNGSISNKEGS